MRAEDTRRETTPPGANAAYLEARRRLVEAEEELLRHGERVAELRRGLPTGPPMPDYVFDEGPRDLSVDEPAVRTSLADLAGGRTLIVYHMMFGTDWDNGCPSCSMWVDGLFGVGRHLEQRVNLAVIAKAPLPTLRAWGRKRGWTGLRLLSSGGNMFNYDMGFEDGAGNQWPGVSVFTADQDAVVHRYTTPMVDRGMDFLSPVWHMFDLTPEGRGDWEPDN